MLATVTGLQAEARLASKLGPVLAGGGSQTGAAKAADRLAGSGATALLSFGLAGGLAPGLAPGTIVVPETVVASTGAFQTDSALNSWLGGARGVLLASDAVAVTSAEKSGLRAKFQADAVDMESGAVAAVARTRGLPFAVLRVICDPAEDDLPPAALAALDAGGSIGWLRVLGSVIRQPGQLPALLRLSSQAVAARRALMRHVAGLAPPAP